MRIAIITGGRNYKRPDLVYRCLERLDPDLVIDGDSGVVDKAAKGWAQLHGKLRHAYPAEWKRHGGPKAGPFRNRTMACVGALLRDLSHDPHEVHAVAFPGHRGTSNCCKELTERGFRVLDGEVLANTGLHQLFEGWR